MMGCHPQLLWRLKEHLAAQDPNGPDPIVSPQATRNAPSNGEEHSESNMGSHPPANLRVKLTTVSE